MPKPKEPEAPMFADEVRSRERKQRTLLPVWQVISFILHGVGFVLLVMLTPLRDIVIPEAKEIKTDPNLTASQLEDLAENVRTIRLNELMEQLDALQIVLHNMDLMKHGMLADYDAFAAAELENSREQVVATIMQAATEQDKAAAAQTSARDAVTAIATMHGANIADTNTAAKITAAMEDVRPLLPAVDTAQGNAQHLLDQVAVKAGFAGLPKTAEAASALREIQLKANTMQREFQANLQNQANAIASYPKNLDRISTLDTIIKRDSEKLAATNKAEAEQRKRAADLDREIAQAEKRIDALKNESAKESTPEAAKEAQRITKQETDSLAQKRKEEKANEAAIERSKAEAARLQKELTLRRNELDAAKERKTAVEALARKGRQETVDAQRETIAAQEALADKARELAKLAEAEEAKLEPLAEPEFRPSPETYTSLAELDLADAYESARQLENKITEAYRDIKSAESAMLRRMAYADAAKLTDVATVVREDLDNDLLRSAPRDRETFDRQKAETEKAIREADSMVETSKMLMSSALEIAGPGQNANRDQDHRLRRMYELSGMSAEMTAAAAESAEEKAKDLSQLMAQAGAEEAAAEEGDEMLMAPPEKAMVAALKSPLPGMLEEFSGKTPDNVPGNIIKFDAAPDSASDGIPAKWMYINSWYVIGPFPNPGRVNLRRRFPPESVVDLDATYLGKDNRTVRWVFNQAQSSPEKQENRPLVIPSTSEQYGIWYAYAEVFVDRDCDVWMAIGSDDRSDLWVNDMHIWGSSNELKAWSINEGFRKVRLNKGRNRFLARIENGWNAVGWSVSIALTDDVSL